MIDTGESDWKIIGVPVDDNRWEDVHGLGDVNKHSLKEVQHFFETYKELKKGEKGMVVIEGFGDKKEAERAVLKSFDLYDTEFNK
jgi:inorganic pyrophosphatase